MPGGRQVRYPFAISCFYRILLSFLHFFQELLYDKAQSIPVEGNEENSADDRVRERDPEIVLIIEADLEKQDLENSAHVAYFIGDIDEFPDVG